MTDRFYIAVREVMTQQTDLIDGLASVRDAINEMSSKKVRALIVNKRDEKDAYGSITVNDIATKVIEPNRSLDRTSVYEVMNKPSLIVDITMNIRYAIRLLARYGESHAVVTDKGQAVGIVTLSDMVLHYIECLK